jgi:hypothetical protein
LKSSFSLFYVCLKTKITSLEKKHQVLVVYLFNLTFN